MTKAHEALKEAATAAMDALASDTSVGPETSRESLEELQAAAQIRIDALDEDIKNAGGE